jgi:hypothetical protein
MTVWSELCLPFERSDEHKKRRISSRIENTSHNTRPLTKMAEPSTLNVDQRTLITVDETLENSNCYLVLLSNEDIKLSKYEKLCSKHTGLPNAVRSTVSSFCIKREFSQWFSVSFKIVNKLKLNIGNVTQALILPTSRSPNEFQDLLWVT